MDIIRQLFTMGYEEERSMIERLIPGDLNEAEEQARELRKLEFIYEATMWHLEHSLATEQILKTAKEL